MNKVHYVKPWPDMHIEASKLNVYMADIEMKSVCGKVVAFKQLRIVGHLVGHQIIAEIDSTYRSQSNCYWDTNMDNVTCATCNKHIAKEILKGI